MNKIIFVENYCAPKTYRVIQLELINLNARYALEQGYDTIVEGILPADKYGNMLRGLVVDYAHLVYYFDIPFDETFRRNQTKPNAHEFGEAEMRIWWQEKDYLGCEVEVTIDDSSSLADTVQRIADDVQRAAQTKV